MAELSGSLPKALKILEFMAEKQANVSFKELRTHTGFAANVLSRLLKTFMEWGYIEKDSDNGYYGLGKGVYSLCGKVLGRRPRKDIIIPVLDGLSAGLQESAAYFDFDGEWMTLLAKSEVANSYHYLDVMSRDVHSPLNGFFFCGLPYMDEAVRNGILESGKGRYGLDPKNQESLFSSIKASGYYVSKEVFRRSDITRICAPVFEGKNGDLAGVLGVTVVTHNLDEKDQNLLVKTVVDSASLASSMF